MDAHAQLGDLVAGWQVHATLDERTRPEHAARNGTIYWLHPKAGQKGVGEMPRAVTLAEIGEKVRAALRARFAERKIGFEVMELSREYDDQYLLIAARPSTTPAAGLAVP